jgi:hypothetical protein
MAICAKRSRVVMFVAASLLGTAALAQQSAKPASMAWTAPKTPWGDPDLQGIWTGDDLHDVPFERPVALGTRANLTEDELKKRAGDVNELLGSIDDGNRRNVGYFGKAAAGVEAAAVPQNWVEFARRASNQTSLVVDPPNGRVPELTEDAKARGAAIRALRTRRPESWLDRSSYDRCITRGVAGSIIPVIYGNGTQIIQMPGMVALRYEMVHETRFVKLDGSPHAPPGLRTYMGDPRGHFEGNTLVIETTNFLAGNLGVGGNGNGGAPYSPNLKLVERFTRTSDKSVQYEMQVLDPQTYTAPWKVSFPITHEDGYQIFEYACHEGNYGLHNILSAARSDDAKEAAANAK